MGSGAGKYLSGARLITLMTGQVPPPFSGDPDAECPGAFSAAAGRLRSARPWMGSGLGDDEVAALEREILDEDLQSPGSPQERTRVDRAALCLADQALFQELAADGFAGILFDVTVTELSAYGIAVMMSWMRTGEIVR